MAVYTPLSKKDIEGFLAQYDVGGLVSFKGITEGIENTNYLLLTASSPLLGNSAARKRPGAKHIGADGGGKVQYILTLFEKRTNPKDVPFFLELTEWLEERDIICPRPIHGKDGKAWRDLKDRPAALVEFLHGRGSPHITPRHLELVGALMARMHLAVKDFPQKRANALSIAGWRSLFTRFKAKADGIAPGLEALMANELQWLEANWPKGLPAGVIHADVFPDNVFFVDGNTDQPELSGIIDFYFACSDFFAYDLMIALNAWCFNAGHQFVPERAQALLKSYQKLRPLSDAEKAALPILGRGSAMRFLATRAYDWINRAHGALVNPKDPMEYVAKLKFHQRVKDARDYGV